jgi:hypothetical protein
LRERSSGIFLELCRTKGSGEGDIILNYINYMMSHTWLNTYINRLKWAGHVMRMDNNRITKSMFNIRPEGKRGTGRPKMRWGNNVDRDIRNYKRENWRNLALNREEWRKLLKKARAHAGLSSQ